MKKRKCCLYVICFLAMAVAFATIAPCVQVEAKSKTTSTKKKAKTKKKKKHKKKKKKKNKKRKAGVSSLTLGSTTPYLSGMKKPGNLKSATSVLYTNTELIYLTCIVQAESGNQPFKGQVAVADVVLNRVNSPLFPNTIKEVIYQNQGVPQFSPTADGAMARMLRNYSKNSAQTRSCRKAAISALRGANYVGNKLFFHVYSNNSSADRSLLSTGKGELIGAHVFY